MLLIKFILLKDIHYLAFDHFKNYNSSFLKRSWQRANFLPFKTLWYYLSGEEKFETGLENIGGNILLFIPYGLLIPVLFKLQQQFIPFLKSIFLLSLTFEIAQLLMAYGNFDIDDIILNVLGASVGFLCVKLIQSSST